MIYVVRKDDRSGSMGAIAQGTEEEVRKMLRTWKDLNRYEVFDGAGYESAFEFARDQTPEEKMWYEDLHNPLIHARNEMVYQHIRRALRLVNEPNYDPELLAKNTAQEIIRLFY